MTNKLEKYDIQKLESFWFDFFDTKNGLKKQLYLRELELLIPFVDKDINSTIKASRTSDLTANKAILLSEDKRYQRLKEIIRVVGDVYSTLEDEEREIVLKKYSEKFYTWEEIGALLYMSKSKVLRIRNKILDLTAEGIGWV